MLNMSTCWILLFFGAWIRVRFPARSHAGQLQIQEMPWGDDLSAGSGFKCIVSVSRKNHVSCDSVDGKISARIHPNLKKLEWTLIPGDFDCFSKDSLPYLIQVHLIY